MRNSYYNVNILTICNLCDLNISLLAFYLVYLRKEKRYDMKNVIIALVVVFAGFNAWSQTSESEQSISWQDVEVVYDLSENECAAPTEKISNSLQTSLNFGTQKKAKQKSLVELKKKAAAKGYKKLFVDESKTKIKRFNKRGIEVSLVGYGCA